MEQAVPSMPGNAADYPGENGLLYCGKCRTPKEAFFAKGLVLMGNNKHPVECSCHKAEREQQEAVVKEQKRLDLVRRKWSCLLKKYYDGETDNTTFVRCIDIMAKLIQKYGSSVLEQKSLSAEPHSLVETAKQAA